MKTVIQEYVMSRSAGTGLVTTAINVPDSCVTIYFCLRHDGGQPIWNILVPRHEQTTTSGTVTDIYPLWADLSGRPHTSQQTQTLRGSFEHVAFNRMFWDIQPDSAVDTLFFLRVKFVLAEN